MEDSGQEKSNDTSQAEEYTPGDAADDFLGMISGLAKTDIKSELNDLMDGDDNNENQKTSREKVEAGGPDQETENQQKSGTGGIHGQEDNNIQSTQPDKQSSQKPNQGGQGGSEDYTPIDAADDIGDVLSGVIDDGSGGSGGEKAQKMAEQQSKAGETTNNTQYKQNTDGSHDENSPADALEDIVDTISDFVQGDQKTGGEKKNPEQKETGDNDKTQGTTDTTEDSKAIGLDELKEAFGYFDNNHDGTVNKEELRSHLTNIDAETLEDVFKAADINGDGQLNIEEMATILLGLQ